MSPLRLLISLLIIVTLVGVLTFGFTIINQRRNEEEHPPTSEGQDNQPSPQQVARPILSTHMYAVNGYWTRDYGSDLPMYTTDIRYFVENVGNGDAENVKVVVKVDEAPYHEQTISLIRPYNTYSNSFSLTITYDNSKIIGLYASCTGSSHSAIITVNATFPRHFDPDLCRLFITPNEANIVSIKNKILNSKFPLTPDWIVLKDWVATNIKYPSNDVNGDGEPDYDYVKHGKWEYWQLPKETLQLRMGDCEDYSILLVSLLRAAGWSPDDVYVVIGKNSEGKGHAWVKIKLNLVLGSVWYNLEPQVGGWNIFDVVFDTWECSGYHAEWYFNDLQCNIVG